MLSREIWYEGDPRLSSDGMPVRRLGKISVPDLSSSFGDNFLICDKRKYFLSVQKRGATMSNPLFYDPLFIFIVFLNITGGFF